MYFPHALSFGIGWCLAFIILLILVREQAKKSSSKGGGFDTSKLDTLIKNLDDVKSQFKNTRFEELKNRESAYSRNPQAFKYDFNGFFKEHDDRVKALDKELDLTLSKCNEFLQDAKAKKQTEQRQEQKVSGKSQFTLPSIIGVIVIIIINIVFFTKLF